MFPDLNKMSFCLKVNESMQCVSVAQLAGTVDQIGTGRFPVLDILQATQNVAFMFIRESLCEK